MRHDLMEIFHTQDDRKAILNDPNVAREYLGISTQEATLSQVKQKASLTLLHRESGIFGALKLKHFLPRIPFPILQTAHEGLRMVTGSISLLEELMSSCNNLV
jgi:hypothetical protein